MTEAVTMEILFQLSDGEVGVWIADGAIHIRAVTPEGDPVELSSEEARELAARIAAVAERIE